MPHEPGKVVAGRYRLLDRIGSGAHGDARFQDVRSELTALEHLIAKAPERPF